MLSERLREWTQGLRAPIARVLGRWGVTPNALTVCGYLLNLPVMLALAAGRLQLGGLLVVVAALFDALDGAVARETGQASTFGALFDSVMDRYSEATVLLGLLLWYQQTGARLELVLLYVTLVGSLMVSYTRARAEGLGLSCKVGLLTRFERVVLLAVGLLLRQVPIVLGIMAVLTNLTAAQRVHHVWQQTKGRTGASGA
jgi:CDP-diacylglycerol--glycerol-3-phosphate 3-phosphatidyltransferase